VHYGKLTEHLESHDGEIPRNGEIEGPATDVNGGNPILEDTTTTDTKNAGLNIPLSSSEDDITPVRSGRRSRPAPILLSSDEGSDLQIASGPFTPSNKPHTQSRSGKNAVKPSDDSDSDSTAQLIPRRTFVSPKTPTNGERSQSRVQLLNGKPTEATPPEAGKALVISSGESSSEDEVVTPARRRRSGIQSADAPAKEVSIEQDDTDDLDDEVADLDDDGA